VFGALADQLDLESVFLPFSVSTSTASRASTASWVASRPRSAAALADLCERVASNAQASLSADASLLPSVWMTASAKWPRGDGPSTEARLTGLLGIQQGIDPLVGVFSKLQWRTTAKNGTRARKR
jgi:hypothetical protein